MNSNVRRAVMALTALLALLGLAACGSTKLKGQEVAAQMKSEALAPKGITDAKVSCPAETEAKAGATIQCSVTSDKRKGDVTAKISDDKGTLTDWKANVDKIQLALIEEKAQQEQSGLSQVDCPSSSKPEKGATFFCTGKIAGSGFGVVIVKQTSEDSNVRVSLQRRKLKTGAFVKNLERQVEKQVPGVNAQVSCPKNIESRRGQVIACTVKNPANGKQITLRYRQATSEADSFKPVN
jgi:hypothetical protein